MSEQHARTEDFHVSGDTLIAKIKELVQEGTVRRVVLENEEGQTLVESPLTLGVVGGSNHV